MSKKSSIIVGLIALVVVLGIVAWSLNQKESAKTETVRYGYLPIASDASFFVALEQGFFTANKLQVEATKFESSNQALEALVANRIDATAVVGLEAALSLEANTPGEFRILEMTAATEKTSVHRIMVKPDSPIKTLAELKGKRIGTFPGSQMVVFLKLILAQYFDAEKEVEIIQIKPSLQPQSLESGQVDALFCLEPTCTLLESKGLGRAISVNPLYEYIQKPFPTAVGVVSSRLQKEKPGVVLKIDKALRSAHEYLKTHPKEASLCVAKYSPIEPEIAPRVSVYDYWNLETMDRDAVQRLSELYTQKGILTKPISTASLYAGPAK